MIYQQQHNSQHSVLHLLKVLRYCAAAMTAPTSSIHIKIVYLGGSRVEAGRKEETLMLQKGASVDDLRALVATSHPALQRLLSSCRWAINFEFAELHTTLIDGDEVGLLPPVAGGGPCATLSKTPIDVLALLKSCTSDSCGATVLFVGTVRDHSRGKGVLRLEYEAYEGMVVRELENIIGQCTQLHAGVSLRIAHRFGALNIGDVSVAIAAASAHRAEAFATCQLAIERIKEDVPIWKREYTNDGASWINWGGG